MLYAEGSPEPGRILIADDEPEMRHLLARTLEEDGFRVITVPTGRAAMKAVEECPPDLVLLDAVMPGLGGFAVCEALKRNPATCLIPIVMVTGLHDRQDRLYAFNVGADDFLTKPIDAHALRARVRSLVRLKRFTDELESADALILSLAQTVEARDPCTQGHCQRLAQYSVQLGTVLGLPAADLKVLWYGGFLHDLGKIGIPDAILLKPAPLTRDEYEIMKAHAAIGDQLCGKLRSLQRARLIVRHHHERLDGTGYPDGLRGEQIPLLAQITGVVDVFDAITTERPYRRAASAEHALAELHRQVAIGWQRADLVEALQQALLSGQLEAPVALSAQPQAFSAFVGSSR